MSLAVKRSPLARMKDEFGGKDKLVDKLVGVLDAGDDSKDDLRKRLLGVANGKLIRLFGVATRAKEAGGHDKLVAAVAERAKHGKDKDYIAKLEGFSDARLLDMLGGGESPASTGAGAERVSKKRSSPANTEGKTEAKTEKAYKGAASAKTSAKASGKSPAKRA